MGQRIVLNNCYKSTDPEKLIVYHASSLENEIRFYFNEEQYVFARDNKNGTLSVEYGEIKKVENIKDNKSILDLIKENFKDFLKIFSLISIAAFLTCVLIFAIAIKVQNIIIFLFIFHFIEFSLFMGSLMMLEVANTPSSLRSKHSAEHMMVNFVQHHRRLPKNMEEIKKSSRFINSCGSKRLVDKIANDFTYSTITIIIVGIIAQCISQYLEKGILLGIIYLIIYIITIFVVQNVLYRHQIFEFLTKFIQNICCNIIQCSNTTKKVEENDIILAYYAAKYWMKEVYPEFYTEDGYIFGKRIS